MKQSNTDIQFGVNHVEPVLTERVAAIRFFISCGFVAAVILCVFSFFCMVPAEFPPPQDTINPNTDPVASLVRLPGVGVSRAVAIVEYRQEYGQAVPAFQTPQDLDAIPGIGPKTIEKMEKWLSMGDNERTSVENQ